MLILQRKEGESLLIGEDVEITVLAVEAGRVRLAIQAPREVPVLRGAVLETLRSPEGQELLAKAVRREMGK